MKETLFHMHDTIRIMPANACFFDVFRFSFPLNFDLYHCSLSILSDITYSFHSFIAQNTPFTNHLAM